MTQVKQQIEDMTVAIFERQRSAEFDSAQKEAAAVESDHVQRGMIHSGAYLIAVTRTFESAVVRALERSLEELALQFRVAGRRDSNLFWNIIEPKIKDLAIAANKAAFGNANQRLRGTGLNTGTITRTSEQSMARLNQLIVARVHECRLKSQFIALKTPDDRRAHGVPDVAIMMWFPDPKSAPEQIEASQERYKAMCEAVREASNGLATVKKFDDPSVIPQDRISESIEIWLEKAAVVICDLAGQRHNVYYEFGYARASGTDVLLTCPQMDAGSTTLHLGHWQRIEYADISDLKSRLIEKLKSLLSKYDLSGSL